jgi:hypothetical protein
VAAEQLVRAVADERDRHESSRRARRVVVGDDRDVGERLPVAPHDRGKVGRDARREHLFMERDAVARGEEPRERPLVESRLVKADRHRVERAPRLLAGDRRHEARVGAAGEQHAGGSVLVETPGDRAADDRVQRVERVALTRAILRREAELPVARHAQLARVR